MNSILKIYLGIFMMLCMTAFSVGLLSMFISVSNVQHLFQEVIENLSLSDYDVEVMEESMVSLKQNGVETEFTLYGEDEIVAVCTEPEMLPVDMSQIDLVKVEVRYPYRIGTWESGKVMRLSGYAG